jgi:hypothetical protein
MNTSRHAKETPSLHDTIPAALVVLGFGAMIAIVLALILGGCKAAPLPVEGQIGTTGGTNLTASVIVQATDNLSVGVQGTGDLATGAWSANIVLIWKSAPSADALALAAKAGAVAIKDKANSFALVYDSQNANHRNLIRQAQLEGAIITR